MTSEGEKVLENEDVMKMKILMVDDHFPEFIHPILGEIYMVEDHLSPKLLTNIDHNSSLLAICAQVLKEPYLSTLGIILRISSKIECLIT